MLDLLLFVALPIGLAVAMNRAFNHSGRALLALTVVAVVVALAFWWVWPDVATLSSPEFGPLHGVETLAFAYAAGVTGGVIAALRAVGLSGGVAASIGAVVFFGVTSTGCWIA